MVVALINPPGLYFLLGDLAILLAGTFFALRWQIGAAVLGLVQSSPGIPFKKGAVENYHPNRFIPASALMVVMGAVFWFQGMARLTGILEAGGQPWPSASRWVFAVLAMLGLALGLWLAFASRRISVAIRARSKGRVPQPTQSAVVVLAASVLLVASGSGALSIAVH